MRYPTQHWNTGISSQNGSSGWAGVAEGTAKMAVQLARLNPYPLKMLTGKDHCEGLSSALATFGQAMREGLVEADGAGDQDTADLYTEVCRGVDQWLWFVEDRLQADAQYCKIWRQA
jgi:starvation-inducible DNA-binding protein